MKLWNLTITILFIATCGLLTGRNCLSLVVAQDDAVVEDETDADFEVEQPPLVNDSWLRLLFAKSVQADLELTEQQVKRIDDAKAQLDEELSQLTSQLNKLSRALDPNRSAENLDKPGKEDRELRRQIQAKIESFQKQVNEILVPSQLKRIKQIQMRFAMRTEPQRYPSTFLTPFMIAQLEIDAKQEAEIAKVVQKSNQELDELVAKHKLETQDKILAVLKKEQREKVEDLLGEEFNFDR